MGSHPPAREPNCRTIDPRFWNGQARTVPRDRRFRCGARRAALAAITMDHQNFVYLSQEVLLVVAFALLTAIVAAPLWF